MMLVSGLLCTCGRMSDVEYQHVTICTVCIVIHNIRVFSQLVLV